MKIFAYNFQILDQEHLEELFQLEREGAIYTDHWFDHLNDFRHIRIKFTPEEIKEYVRSLWALELFIKAGCPPKASDVPEIPTDIAERADTYSLKTIDGKIQESPYHCPAAFLGPELESLVCTNIPGRYDIIEELGIENFKLTLRRAIDALTPSIRLFNKREKTLANWAITCEDDIRDLLYAMLRASISDIKREEPVPTKAGTYKFVDLVSQIARIFIEIKWIDKKGTWRRIIKEINDDIQSYITHPACQNLVFIVIDNIKDIPDPVNFEKDLSGTQKIGDKEVKIEVYVREP